MIQADDRQAISTALFGLGLLLPLTAGGNVFFLLEPEEGIRYFSLATLGVSWLLSARSTSQGSPPIVAASFLVVLVASWCGNLVLRPFGPRALTEAQGVFCAALLYGVFSWRPLDAPSIRRLVAGLLVGAILTTIYGQYQYWVMYPRVTRILGTIGQEPITSVNANFYNANCYAPFLAAVILLGASLRDPRSSAALRRLPILGIPILLVTLALTGSRSTQLLLLVIALGLGGRLFRPLLQRRKAVACTTLTVSLLAAAIVTVIFADLDELWTTGTRGRIAIWQGALAMIKDNWLFGVGLGQFADHFVQYRVTNYYTRYPHNLLLEVFAEMGVVATVALIGFCAAALAASVRSLLFRRPVDSLQALLISAAVLLLVHALMDIDWHASGNPILLFTLLAISQRERGKEIE